jgi:hypothetical protein
MSNFTVRIAKAAELSLGVTRIREIRRTQLNLLYQWGWRHLKLGGTSL